MTAWRRVMELAIEDEDLAMLREISRSRRSRRAEWNGHECCWHTGKTPLSSRWGEPWVSIIRPFSELDVFRFVYDPIVKIGR